MPRPSGALLAAIIARPWFICQWGDASLSDAVLAAHGDVAAGYILCRDGRIDVPSGGSPDDPSAWARFMSAAECAAECARLGAMGIIPRAFNLLDDIDDARCIFAAFAYRDNGMVGPDDLDCVHPDDLAMVLAALNSAV